MEKNYAEIDLRKIFNVIWKKIWLVILISSITTTLSIWYNTYLVQPMYKASTELLVNQTYPEDMQELMFQRQDIYTSIELINTYNVVIKSPRILDKVIQDYKLDMDSRELSNMITVSSVTDSMVMSISVTHTDHSKAVFIANSIASTFQKEIKELMRVNNVHIMAEAKEQANPVSINTDPFTSGIIAFFLGVMISLGIIFLFEFLDGSIKTEEDIEDLLGLPVLGTISKINPKTEKKYMKRNNAPTMGGEQIEA